MSSFLLRLTALICMMVDHAGLALFPNVGFFRCVGRAAFPLYCFLLVQGYLHTHDLRAYMRRLLLLAILSEIPFDLLIFGRVSSMVEQNTVFSLMLGLLAVLAADAMPKERSAWPAALAALLALCAMLTRVSYGWLCVALCLCFYYGRRRPAAAAGSAGAALLLYSLSLLLSGVAMSWVLVSLCALFSLPLILLYNGRRGPRLPALSFLFYAAYPLHLLALCAVRAMRIIPPYFLG